MASEILPKQAPVIEIPASKNTCTVSIINTTTLITEPPSSVVGPDIPGHKWINLPTFAYYIVNNQSRREILFDAGCRKDISNANSLVKEILRNVIPGFRVDKNVTEILTEGGVNINNLKAFIPSHHHFDHVGNPAILAKSTDMVVGPGFKDRFWPGYPTKQDSQFWEDAFQGRNVYEPDFDDRFKIGSFQANDFFGDGSFYLLNTPGHATGHISALVRTTTNPFTFILLGGDVCHITGSLRPNPYMPLPEHVPEGTALDKRIPKCCPCSAFTSSHRDPANSRTSPFYQVSTTDDCVYEDIPVSEESIEGIKAFDADPNILVSIAHDPTGLEVFDFFPKGTANDWKRKGWKEQMHWGFLSELPYNGKTVREPLVDGLYDDDGKKLRDLEFNWIS